MGLAMHASSMEEMNTKTLLVTGGAGFIGSNFIRYVLDRKPAWHIINLDALTYAGNPANLDDLAVDSKDRYCFVHGSICDRALIDRLMTEENFDGVAHFAAETHVDRSIHGPLAFVKTNVVGTMHLLDASLKRWQESGRSAGFRFLHVSTDEVYGSLGPEGCFTEETPYDPSSPYSASKAGSGHLVKAYWRTYGLPTVITNCSNNYGPYQFPEKLIPLMIRNIMEGKELPVYGDGRNIRDWLYVVDHCDALLNVLEKGKPGETYNIGGNEERQNIEIVERLCDLLDQRLEHSGVTTSRRLIRYVTDRPGHDRRYAIDASKIKKQLGWSPRFSFEQALDATVDWYLKNMEWVNSIRSGEYIQWIKTNYSNRALKG
jgi:dTDP-glucose 4,6-dehydratase